MVLLLSFRDVGEDQDGLPCRCGMPRDRRESPPMSSVSRGHRPPNQSLNSIKVLVARPVKSEQVIPLPPQHHFHLACLLCPSRMDTTPASPTEVAALPAPSSSLPSTNAKADPTSYPPPPPPPSPSDYPPWAQDPENPLNWPIGRKWTAALVVSITVRPSSPFPSLAPTDTRSSTSFATRGQCR